MELGDVTPRVALKLLGRFHDHDDPPSVSPSAAWLVFARTVVAELERLDGRLDAHRGTIASQADRLGSIGRDLYHAIDMTAEGFKVNLDGHRGLDVRLDRLEEILRTGADKPSDKTWPHDMPGEDTMVAHAQELDPNRDEWRLTMILDQIHDAAVGGHQEFLTNAELRILDAYLQDSHER
jgi:hypothetical protein